jgi:hypothetical protein
MPISELNNGILQQCSTIPSGDAGLCSGGMTQQQKRSGIKNNSSLIQNQMNSVNI